MQVKKSKIGKTFSQTAAALHETEKVKARSRDNHNQNLRSNTTLDTILHSLLRLFILGWP